MAAHPTPLLLQLQLLVLLRGRGREDLIHELEEAACIDARLHHCRRQARQGQGRGIGESQGSANGMQR